MANSKLICKQCREYKPRELYIKSRQTRKGNFCSDDCLLAFALDDRNQKAAKAKIIKEAYGQKRGGKKHKTRKQLDNDLRTRKRAAKEACHEYIRYRDRKDPCICCGKPLTEGFQAGHYIESGNNPKVRYDENNIHGQNLNCNYFKGGDSGFYRVNLIEKIGLEEVERLESMKGGTVKRTPQDYKEIEVYYKNKLKELQNCT